MSVGALVEVGLRQIPLVWFQKRLFGTEGALVGDGLGVGVMVAVMVGVLVRGGVGVLSLIHI